MWRGLGAFFALWTLAISAQSQTLPTAQQVASQMNVGWNLGNTLEAICSETAWGNPATNQQLINAVKAAGFNAIRIPVSWNCHITDGSTNIPAAWTTRVKQVVDMAIAANMYVIINIHWDNGWLQDHVTFADQQAVNARQNALWTQIATTFRNYDQHLLFAGTNEVHADYGTPTAEHNTVQQSYNQTFVNAVRATGGNNASRTLVVQTYNTNIQHGLNFFNLPTDTIASRLMVEVHYYDPYDFTLNPTGSCNFWGAPYPDSGSNCNWAYEAWIDQEFAKVRQKWVDQGVPVIVGEYGVETRSGKSLEARAYWNEYVNRAAALNGFKTFYWDNGATSANTFRIFDRNTGAVVDQVVLDAILRGSGVGNPGQMYTLTTTSNPGNGGTVTRSPTGSSFPGGTDVTLTATPAAGNDFVGWTGDASGATNPKVVRILGTTSVTANFVPSGTGGSGSILREYWLNVTGNTVASLTGNANYPNSPTGSEPRTSFEGPTNAADNYGSRFRGYVHPPISGAYTFWTASDDASDLLLSTNDSPANATRIAFVSEWTDSRQWTKYTSQRSASINLVGGQKYYIEAIQKEATGGDNLAISWQGPGMSQAVIPGNFLSPFVPSGGSFALSIAKAGTGSGTVTSSPAGINCGATCSASYSNGTSVTLTAAAASGSTFAGWSGACSGTAATCSVSMTQARSVTATFNSSGSTFTLSVAKNGTGAGTVSGGGINCGTVCSASVASNTNVTLTAAAASGSTFAGWSGACTGTTSTCTVSMTAARSVTATFNSSSSFALAVTRAGTGTGTVTSSPAGISCGTTCTANYSTGTSVTLTAAAATGSTFGGWSGACSGTASCVLSMTAARNVTATFNGGGTGGTCTNPVTFTNNTGNFNTTGAACFRTNQNISGWGCSNFDGRTVTVGGQARTCGQLPLTRSADGYYYFAVTAGTYPWASIYVW